MRTIELGVMITDAAVDENATTIFCSPVVRDPRCPDCGQDGRYRDTVIRPLADLPVAGYPLVLRVAVPRYRCSTPACGRAVFNQDLGKLAAPRSATTRRCARYVLRRLMIDRTTIAAIAAELGVSWHTVNSVAMRETRRSFQNLVGTLEFSVFLLKIFDPLRFRGRHSRRVPVIDVGLTHPGTHRFDAIPKLAGHPVHRPVLGA